MGLPQHPSTGAAAKLPVPSDTPFIVLSPIDVPSKSRAAPLTVKVSAPVTGQDLPVVLLSHGHGRSNYLSSYNGYGPIADFWAAHGFVVISPTHMSSRFYSDLTPPAGEEMFWKSRIDDMSLILDDLDAIEESVPTLKGRMSKTKIAIAGHSFGGFTTSMLLGATNTDPRDGTVTSKKESRIRAGVVFGGTGLGGDSLSENGKTMVPFYNVEFSKMTTPTLVLAGDIDVSPHLTCRGADWHADPYLKAPGQKDLLWVKGGHHGFGGISGYDAGETQDESPERLALVQRMSLAYMKSQLNEGDKSWEEACTALAGLPDLGSFESKSA